MRPATDAERDAWRSDWTDRLGAWYDRPGSPPGWAAGQAADRAALLSRVPDVAVCALTDSAGQTVGTLALAALGPDGNGQAVIADIWIDPGVRRRGYATAAAGLATDWARARRCRSIVMTTRPGDRAHEALFARYPVAAYQMIKELAGPAVPAVLPAGLVGRPMTAPEFAGWRETTISEFAAEMAESGIASPAEAVESAADQTRQLLPDGLSTPGHTFLCLCSGDGEVVATNWIQHHRSPGVSWVYGVEVHDGHRGRGYGRAAMIAGEQASLDAGDTHLALNVFGQNAVAIGLYRSMGYVAYDSERACDL